MKKGDKKKQAKALKRRSQSSQERRLVQRVVTLNPRSVVWQARTYPIESCWAQKDWKESGLAIVVVARRQPDGNLVFGNYLVDYYCLGLKNTMFDANVSPAEFHQMMATAYSQTLPPIKISPELAHEIIYGGIEYAARLGFKPQRDFRDSQYILEPANKYPRSGRVEFGKDGKPFFVNGPYDNVDKILEQLTRAVGEGNFEYFLQVGPLDDDDDDFFLPDNEEIEDE
jgi:hypothetical protein